MLPAFNVTPSRSFLDGSFEKLTPCRELLSASLLWRLLPEPRAPKPLGELFMPRSPNPADPAFSLLSAERKGVGRPCWLLATVEGGFEPPVLGASLPGVQDLEQDLEGGLEPCLLRGVMRGVPRGVRCLLLWLGRGSASEAETLQTGMHQVSCCYSTIGTRTCLYRPGGSPMHEHQRFAKMT
jgi:hypothetical protein